MWKKYWDIILGFIVSLILSALARNDLEKIQTLYSDIILILVSIGFFKVIKQSVDKGKKDRAHNLIDNVVDAQHPIKALNMAVNPTKAGEAIGKIILLILRGVKKKMKNFTEFWSKFKGYILTFALAILTGVEMCGGFINGMFGDVLYIKGVAILPVITLSCTVVVGLISNGYSREQNEKIQALLSGGVTNDLVIEEIKKTIKEKSAELTQANKTLSTMERDAILMQNEFDSLTKTLQAKREMYGMTPQLATAEDVQAAAKAVADAEKAIAEHKNAIEATKAQIENLNTIINALKSQYNAHI